MLCHSRVGRVSQEFNHIGIINNPNVITNPSISTPPPFPPDLYFPWDYKKEEEAKDASAFNTLKNNAYMTKQKQQKQT